MWRISLVRQDDGSASEGNEPSLPLFLYQPNPIADRQEFDETFFKDLKQEKGKCIKEQEKTAQPKPDVQEWY